MPKMHKIEVYVIDYEDFGAADCAAMIHRNAPDYVAIHTHEVGTVDIGEWHDQHELNFWYSGNEKHEKYFK